MIFLALLVKLLHLWNKAKLISLGLHSLAITPLFCCYSDSGARISLTHTLAYKIPNLLSICGAHITLAPKGINALLDALEPLAISQHKHH